MAIKEQEAVKAPPVEVTAVAEPYPDGQKITKAILTFQDALPDLSEIVVKGRTVTGRRAEGKTVTLELSPEDEGADVLPQPPFGGPPPKQGGHRPGGPEKGGGPGEKRRGIPERRRRPVQVTVRVPGWPEDIPSVKAVQPLVDDFIQDVYEGIAYNLYIPKDYDESRRYPIVLFIPDASANGDDVLLTLVQGIGATCWVTPEEQAKHPCFVLAPQLDHSVRLTSNDHQASPKLEVIKRLLDSIVERFSIDRGRIYATGQSQGCMASCELNIRYPEYFAASMLVSGHWDIEKMTKLTNCRFLIGLSEGGRGEYPNMTAIAEGLAANGVNVATVRLNFRDGWEINNAKVREAGAGAQVVYAVFDKETAFPDDGKQRPDIAHHNRGWELTYAMEAARDWLFAQHK